MQTTNDGTRTTISLVEAAAGGFRGDIRFTFYRNSPLIHVETVVTTQEDWRAMVYDAGLESPAPSWEAMAWNGADGRFQSVKYTEQGVAVPIAVAGRTIVASSSAGSLAVFPPPHQFFYPQDEAYNLRFVWHGWNYRQRAPGCGFGIRQSDTGDKRFVPWFNAPPAHSSQTRMGPSRLPSLRSFPATANRFFRQRIDLADTESFGTRRPRLPPELKGRTWVRLEVWDIAANGAFTQPVWIESKP